MSGISEERLVGMSALCQGVCADMEGTPQNCLRDLIAEVRRLRAENARLRDDVRGEALKMVEDMYPSSEAR